MPSPLLLLRDTWDRLRTSLWFVPTLIVSGLIVLAAVLVYSDGIVGDGMIEAHPRLFGAGAEGSRGMLTAIASSMITVAGVTFSITIVVLSLASSQYSPRILRNFMGDRFNQAVLGAFLGIFGYCLVVVRTIRAGDEPFVPSLAVFGGVVLAFVGIGVLIAFIHHIIASIQAEHIIASAAFETLEAIDHLFPEPIGEEHEAADPDLPRFLAETAWLPLPAVRSGYLRDVDGEGLIRFAERLGAIARMEKAPGEFCVAGGPLLSMAYRPDSGRPIGPVENRDRLLTEGGDEQVDRLAREADRLFDVSRSRSVGQDVGFGIQQIVDVALKALSPGVNETTTAVTCLHYLTAVNARLAERRIEARRRAHDGRLRVIAAEPSFGRLLADSFEPIRRNAEGNVTVLAALLSALEQVGRFARDDDRRRLLLGQALEVVALADRSVRSSADRASLAPQSRRVLEALGGDGDAAMPFEPAGGDRRVANRGLDAKDNPDGRPRTAAPDRDREGTAP